MKVLNVLTILLQIGLTVNVLQIAHVHETFKDICTHSETTPTRNDMNQPIVTQNDIISYFPGGLFYKLNNQEILKQFMIFKEDKLQNLKRELTVLSLDHNFFDILDLPLANCKYYIIPNQNQTSEAKQVDVYLTLPLMEQNLYNVIENELACYNEIMWHIDIMLKVTTAVGNLHSLDYVHRNIKLKSIIFREPKAIKFPFSLILVDYRFALKKEELCTASPEDTDIEDKPSFYKPNELSETLKADPSYDVYQLGKLFYYMLNKPIVEATEFQPDIIKSREDLSLIDGYEDLDFDDYYYDHFKDLVLKMINTGPEQRPSIEEVRTELIQIRDSVDDYISTERAALEESISVADKALGEDPDDTNAQELKKQNEEELADFPITHSMYVEELKKDVEGLYKIDHPIRINFNKMYANELAAIEERKKMLNEGIFEENDIRILV